MDRLNRFMEPIVYCLMPKHRGGGKTLQKNIIFNAFYRTDVDSVRLFRFEQQQPKREERRIRCRGPWSQEILGLGQTCIGRSFVHIWNTRPAPGSHTKNPSFPHWDPCSGGLPGKFRVSESYLSKKGKRCAVSTPSRLVPEEASPSRLLKCRAVSHLVPKKY